METLLRTANRAIGGTAGMQSAVQAPVSEQLASINADTLKNLYEARYALDDLFYKVKGPYPANTDGDSAKADRNLTSDAYSLRDLSYQILHRVQELHNAVGPTG